MGWVSLFISMKSGGHKLTWGLLGNNQPLFRLLAWTKMGLRVLWSCGPSDLCALSKWLCLPEMLSHSSLPATCGHSSGSAGWQESLNQDSHPMIWGGKGNSPLLDPYHLCVEHSILQYPPWDVEYVLCSFYKFRNWSSERLGSLPRTTQVASPRAG